MKMVIFIITFVFSLSSLANAQENLPKSIFEVGKPITKCEDNFDNLIRNWNMQNIDNADDIKILKYEYADIIQDSLQLSNYTDSIATLDYPFSCTRASSSCRNGDHFELMITNNQMFLDDPSLSLELKALQRIFFLQEGYKQKRRLQHLVLSMGTEVYRLWVEQHNVKYRILVFFDAKTHRVIYESVFSKIPLKHIKQ